MTVTSEIFTVIISLVGTVIMALVAVFGWFRYKETKLKKEVEQDTRVVCKLDVITLDVGTIKDDVKALKGLDKKVDDLCSRVVLVEKATSKIGEKMDTHIAEGRK